MFQRNLNFVVALLCLLGLSGCKMHSVKDIEGNTYKTIKIGTQVWMSENLRSTKFNDGTPIPPETDNDKWAKLSSPAYSWYFNDENQYKKMYGALYNFQAVNTGKLCPAGWHVPTESEWNTLVMYQDGFAKAGGVLKEAGTEHWKIPNTDATNETGFTALPGGYRSFEGAFNYVGISGYWWCSSRYNEASIVFWNLRYKSGSVFKYRSEETCGFSVRCIKDTE